MGAEFRGGLRHAARIVSKMARFPSGPHSIITIYGRITLDSLQARTIYTPSVLLSIPSILPFHGGLETSSIESNLIKVPCLRLVGSGRGRGAQEFSPE
jgi:hypothetical protein